MCLDYSGMSAKVCLLLSDRQLNCNQITRVEPQMLMEFLTQSGQLTTPMQ
jgi:hypothetical protein